MEEKIVITDRRRATGRTKPIIFFILQLTLLEMISLVFLFVFDAFDLLGYAFIGVAQFISISFMVKGYQRVMRRQKIRQMHQDEPEISLRDIEEISAGAED